MDPTEGGVKLRESKRDDLSWRTYSYSATLRKSQVLLAVTAQTPQAPTRKLRATQCGRVRRGARRNDFLRISETAKFA